MKTANNRRFSSTLTRREILRRGMAGISLAGLSGTVLAPSLIGQAAHAAAAAQANEKILVILELSGGNDGLNTVVPYGDDAYYRHRPNIGLAKGELRILDAVSYTHLTLPTKRIV